MRKILLCMLCVALVVSFAGCAREQDALIGSWQGTVDLSQAINADFAQDQNLAPHMQISGFCFGTTMTFYRDGTYTMTVDRSELKQVMDDLMVQLTAGMEKYIQTLAQAQSPELTAQDYLASLGLTLEDLFADAYTEATVDEMLSQLEMAGNFQVEEGKLFLSRDKQYAVNTAVWELYTVEGDTLTIDVSDPLAENRYADMIYPMVFTRVAEEE